MFDGGAPNQFVAPFLLHPSTAAQNSFLPFDPYNPYSHHHHQQLPLQTTLLHHHSPAHKNEDNEASSEVSSINFEIERDQRQLPELVDSWTNDEVLALLRIRSTMENCFPQLTWEHVSRKLEEIGFKKSADKCKEKFEDESRYFNNINCGKSYRFLSELEVLYQGGDDDPTSDEKSKQLEKPMEHALEESSTRDIDDEEPAVTKQCDKVVDKSREKKRKRRERFEMLKGFCESVVNQMMAQQEEIHNKLLNDMLKRDEEKLSREEEWKKQEADRMNKEHEMMAQELELARDKHATIVESLKKYVSSSPSSQRKYLKCKTKGSNQNSRNPSPSTFSVRDLDVLTRLGNYSGGENNLEPTPSSNLISLDNHHRTITPTSPSQNNSNFQNPSSSTTLSQVPSSSNSSPPTNNRSCNSSLNNHDDNPLECSNSVSTYKATSTLVLYNEKEDIIGRRWPRDEVLALINLRSMSLNNNNSINNNEEKDQGNKGPLWERISLGMSELGYKRSAKRCKEKWENINKYFRKTKDVNKKRSLDSRTCPYFHQLSCLYNNQGKLIAPQSQKPGTHLNNSTVNSGKVPLDQPQAESSLVV